MGGALGHWLGKRISFDGYKLTITIAYVVHGATYVIFSQMESFWLACLFIGMSRAAVAIGADGLIVEVHPCPAKAVSDGAQSLDIPMFQAMMADLDRWIELWKAGRMAEAAEATV